MNKKLSQALREHAAAIDESQNLETKELVRVLARIVEGKTIDHAFGAPGDWGYGTPIGDGVYAMLQEPLPPSSGEPEWHYLPELPDPDTTVLIATDNPDSDEILIGSYDSDHGDWWEDGSVMIEKPVYAWAYAPAKPAKKGGAS